MEMGNSDSSGGYTYVDYGGSSNSYYGNGSVWSAIIILVIFIGISCALHECKQEEYRNFCTNVCSQYHDEPVIQGSQCYCKDETGIYDPGLVQRKK